ncbi:MAG: ferredoxin--NADP reductase [candidate division Zixibacteria bacterium]|nr:ferredoxin--NADP reductase [candidate division Zixibacteria bacterium]
MAQHELNAIVAQRIEVTPSLIKLRVVPDGWELPDFTPGQFSALGLPSTAPRHKSTPDESHPLSDPNRTIKRAYSVASSSVAKEYLEYFVGLVRTGSLSPRLFALKEGDRLFVSPKFRGMFTLSDVSEEFNVALFATGTGVAPYMSMIRTELTLGLKRRFAVVHGACHSRDLGYHDELKALSLVSQKFDYLPVLSHAHEEPISWKGYEGFVQKMWTERVLADAWGIKPNADNTHIFLCGNPLMIDAMLEILHGEGFTRHSRKEPGQVHVESF